jgi:choline-sulfatase
VPDLRRVVRAPRLIAGLLVAGAVLSTAFGVAWYTARKPPNLILISIDTLRPDHLSTYGYLRDTSPTLTEIARDGVRFTNAFAQAPWTVPSHASLLTGRYPCAHGANAKRPIATTVPLLAERLLAADYRTAGFVEIPYLGPKYGFDRGFQTYEVNEPGDLTTFGRIAEWLRKQKDAAAPFFLFYHALGVHGPYAAPKYLVDRYTQEQGATVGPDPVVRFLSGVGFDRGYLPVARYRTLGEIVAAYDAGIRHVDDELKLLVALMKLLGLYDDSVIIVTSDHGESLFDHGIWVGHGLFLYDDEIRVPLVIKPARVRPALETSDLLVQSVDVLPTVMELLGQPVPKDVDGHSLAGLIHTGASVREDEFAFGMSNNTGETPYIRTRDWKYIGRAGYTRKTILQWHLKSDPRSEVAQRLPVLPQLFDLVNDPGEHENLIAERPEVAAKMKQRVQAILARCVRPGGDRAGEVQLDEHERQRLRALGYVN